ncbi:hypothetical protein Aperf_G00000129668 [Anoplocephala perfoliata]
MVDVLSCTDNLITSLVDEEGNGLLEEDNLPALHTLELRENAISAALPELDKPLSEKQSYNYRKYLHKIGLYHTGLKVLILPSNHIQTMASVYRPPATEDSDKLILTLNPFGSRMGLLPNLVILHLRGNAIKSLIGFTREAFTSLKYLNLRDNQIKTLEDLENLRELVSLEHIVLTGNKVEKAKRFFIEILVLNMNLRRIDKLDYLEEDYAKARLIAAKRKPSFKANE